MTLNFWDKMTGVREHPAFCPRCGVDVQPWRTRNTIFKFHCQGCDMKAVVTINQVPDKCPNCGIETRSWKSEGPVANTEKVPGEFCAGCMKVVEEYQRELARGGIAWRCVDCRGEGIEKADSAFAKAVRKEHPGGALVQMSRKNGCPLCGHLARMEN